MLRSIKAPGARVKRLFERGARNTCARFCAARDGNIAILFSFMLAVLMLFTGGAVDYTRFNAVRADLIESMDAAGLAMAQIDAINGPDISGKTGAERDAYLIEQGRNFFYENFKFENLVDDLNVDFDITAATITPKASGRIDTIFLGVGENLLAKMNGGTSAGGLASLDLTTETEITRKGSGKIELALVLDVTGSMGSKAKSSDTNTKIESLRTAVDNLLQVMFGDNTSSNNLKIGVVPFNAYVNAGGASSWQASWGDQNAESYYHGARFLHVNGSGTVDTSANATAINPAGLAKVIDVDQKVNHFTLFNSHNDLDWAGCVEARPFPLDELDTAPGSAVSSTDIDNALDTPDELDTPGDEFETRTKTAFDGLPSPQLTVSQLSDAVNSRFVPLFQSDEPDCNNSECGYSASGTVQYTMSNGVVRNVTGSGSMFTDPDNDDNSESAYGNRYFIDDATYVSPTAANLSSGRLPRYLEVVLGFRMTASYNYSQLDNYWDDVRRKFRDNWGATELNDDEYVIRNSYVGWWDSSLNRYVGKYDQSPDVNENFNSGIFTGASRGPNRNCPAPLLPMTSDRTAIEDHMDLLEPAGNTDAANGAIWGVRLLSPQAPFTEGVPYSDGQWSKALVLMTDGENTVGSADTHWASADTSYGYAREQRMGQGINTSSEMRDEINEKLLRICHRAKQEGVLVYTIIFGLDDADTEEVFKACATEAKAPYYYKAPSAAQLETAFGDIAQDLVKLHVSK